MNKWLISETITCFAGITISLVSFSANGYYAIAIIGGILLLGSCILCGLLSWKRQSRSSQIFTGLLVSASALMLCDLLGRRLPSLFKG